MYILVYIYVSYVILNNFFIQLNRISHNITWVTD
jgi:hypothetical protein